MSEKQENENKIPTTLELQEMVKELAMFCDELKNEIAELRRDLVLHEHGKGGVLIPINGGSQ